jgi:tRNA (guanine37-N1)-methyltransferase
MTLRIEVVTLFPEMVRGALEFGVVGRAVKRGLVQVGTEDPRTHTRDAHRTVDDRPFGGGPGMVMKPEPMLAAIAAAQARLPAGALRICLSAQGAVFGQEQARELAQLPGFVLVAGRYEGLDERVIEAGIDRGAAGADGDRCGDASVAGRVERRTFECRGVLCGRAARLAALHAARGVRG